MPISERNLLFSEELYGTLFYSETSSKVKYGRQPFNDFDLQRMMDGRPEWIQPSPVKQKKNKTLILNSELFKYRDESCQEKITEILLALMTEIDPSPPFKIFINTQEGLILLTNIILSQKDWTTRMQQGDEKEIMALASQNKIARDSIKIINDYWLDCILHGYLLPENYVYDMQIIQLGYQNKLSTLNEYPFSSIIHEYYGFDDDQSIAKFIRSSNITKSEYQWKHAYIKQADLQQLLYNVARIRNNRQIFSSNHLEELELLRTDIIHCDVLQQLSKKATRLKSLSCVDIIINNPSLQLEIGAFKALSELSLSDPSLSTKQLSMVLKSMPNLERLKLNSAKLTQLDHEIEFVHLPKLKELSIGRSAQITRDHLEVLLRANRELKSVSIIGCNILEGSGSFAESVPMNLQLDSLTIQSKTFTSGMLNAILSSSSASLKNLDLTFYPSILEVSIFSSQYFPVLEELNLNATIIPSSQLANIIQACPNLKSLNLTGCRQLTETLKVNPASLVKLENLYLDYSTISSEILSSLLKTCPNLKKLSFKQSQHLTTKIDFTDITLKNLEILDLEGFKGASDNLYDLLKACSTSLIKLNLNHVNLKDITFAPHLIFDELKGLEIDGYQLPKHSSLALLANTMPNLKKISTSIFGLSNLSLSPSKHLGDLVEIKYNGWRSSSSSVQTKHPLQNLLELTPNVRILEIKSSNKLMKENPLLPNSIPFLKKLDIYDCFFDEEEFTALILSAPNLKTLKIRDMNLLKKNIRDKPGNIHLPPNCLYHLREITLEQDLSDNNLETLAIAAPQLRETILSHKRQPSSSSHRAYPETSHFTGSTDLSSNSIMSTMAQTPQHDAASYKNFTPHDESEPFSYEQGKNCKDQNMLIKQLSQYYRLTHQHETWIPKLQDGFCLPLTYFFTEAGSNMLNELLDEAQSWNGEVETLSVSLKSKFDLLYPFIENYQDKKTDQDFIGSHLSVYLQALPINHTIVLSNPWHVCGIRKIDEINYELFNSNAPNGIQFPLTLSALGSAIVAQMGALISVTNPDISVPNIDDIQSFNTFIEQGGLFVLCESSNIMLCAFNTMKSSINSLEASHLEGLLLRNISGTPAWMVGLNSKHPNVKALSFSLLERFKQVHGVNAEALLTESMEAVSSMQRQKLAETLTTPLDTPDNTTQITGSTYSSISSKINSDDTSLSFDKFRRELLSQCRHQVIHDIALSNLSPWQINQTHFNSTRELSQTLLQGCDKTINRLLRCDDDEAVYQLCQQLVTQAIDTGQAVFYINGPEALRCNAPFMRRDGKALHFEKGPGGPLFEFLKDCHANQIPPVIVVNYNLFDDSDMVTFNSLIDSVSPKADGVELPEKTRVIGVINTQKPAVYQGSDFYSRFDKKYDNAFSTKELSAANIPSHTSTIENNPDKTMVINLFHSSDWKARLLGSCVLHGGSMHFEEGQLLAALKTGAPIEIQNGLWDDEEFCAFWHNLTIGQGVYYAGDWYQMPHNNSIKRQNYYDWASYSTHFSIHTGFKPDLHQVINRATLKDFLGGYIYDETFKGLIRQTGLIESLTPGARLSVNVTDTLKDDTWAQLLDACQNKGILLDLHCAPGVSLPKTFNHTMLAPNPPQIFSTENLQPDNAFKVIQSTDRATTLAMLKETINDAEVLCISGLSPEDLLEGINSHFDKNEAKLTVTPKEGALISKLKSGNPLILTGQWSEELAQAISAFLLKQKPPLPITLLSDSEKPFLHFSEQLQHHDVTIEEKCRFLPEDVHTRLPSEIIATESLSKINARLLYMAAHPQSVCGDEAWAGYKTLSSNIQVDASPIDFTSSATEAANFKTHRMLAVTKQLKHTPYAYLTGLTGVGKTTFVETTFTPEKGYQLFHEAEDIIAWATSSAPAPILFLDEANMSDKDWAIFEGLFQAPPCLIENGVSYPLEARHKVIFAGNPSNYGDDRQLNDFFNQFGGAVLFEPLPKSVLYEDVLKPIFNNQSTLTQETIQVVCQDILNAYALVMNSHKDEILISPRELQMMALLGLSKAQGSPDELRHHIQTAILDIASPLLHSKPSVLQQLHETFTLPNEKKAPASSVLNDTFYVTERQAPILAEIQSFLALRDWRVQQAEQLNDAQKFGGLGALLLEGGPGGGKSMMFTHALIAAGYEEEHDFGNVTTKTKPFYKLPASMSLPQKQALLEKAFKEGAVVLIDEMNSSPMMEHMFNAMLMGYHPITHERPKPGFMILGTQNPISMAGRRVASPALSRRMTCLEMPEYNKSELTHILIQHKGLPEAEAIDLIELYFERITYAKAHHLHPIPCFRDLEKIADTLKVALGTFNPEKTPDINESMSVEPSPPSNCSTSFFQKPIPTKKPRSSVDELINEAEAAGIKGSELLGIKYYLISQDICIEALDKKIFTFEDLAAMTSHQIYLLSKKVLNQPVVLRALEEGKTNISQLAKLSIHQINQAIAQDLYPSNEGEEPSNSKGG